MLERKSLKWPITLGVILLVLLALLLVGWIVLSVLSAMSSHSASPLYWTLFAVGLLMLVLVIVGVSMYLTLTVKAINLNQRQSNFVDSVTHELKSPIASLKLYLQTLNRRAIGPEEQAMFFHYMLEDVERLDRLITHLLAVARMDRNPSDADYEEVELEPLLRRCVADLALNYQTPPDTFHLDIQPSVVRGRRVDLDMVFRNLIDNATKYAGQPPHVTIVSKPSGEGRVITQIIDNGRGIPLRYRRKIFGRFVRLGSELEREKPGTGLGLYIVHTLIKQLRGKVRVTDREGTSGTVFEVDLPGSIQTTASADVNSSSPKSHQQSSDHPGTEIAIDAGS